jgi:hypothetical protein
MMMKMGTGSVPETLEHLYTLTWLSALEDFLELFQVLLHLLETVFVYCICVCEWDSNYGTQ